MTRSGNHKLLWAALLSGLALTLMPLPADAAQATWLDEITALTMEHRDLAKMEGREGSYDRIVGQLAEVRQAYEFRNVERINVAMNRFMDMLEADAKGGGIPKWSAKEIFDFCGKVTPVNYHDYKRHNPVLSGGGFDYWDDEVWDPGASG